MPSVLWLLSGFIVLGRAAFLFQNRNAPFHDVVLNALEIAFWIISGIIIGEATQRLKIAQDMNRAMDKSLSKEQATREKLEEAIKLFVATERSQEGLPPLTDRRLFVVMPSGRREIPTANVLEKDGSSLDLVVG